MTIDTVPTSQRAHSLSTEQLSVGTARGTQYPAPLTTSKRQQVAKGEKTIMTTTGFQNISKTEVCGRPRLAGALLLGALASGALPVGALSSPAVAGATCVSVDQLARKFGTPAGGVGVTVVRGLWPSAMTANASAAHSLCK